VPYRSAAQRRFFHSPGAARAGLTSADVAEWDAASKGKKVPERVGGHMKGLQGYIKRVAKKRAAKKMGPVAKSISKSKKKGR
jgi:hypothetical protein